jgi:cobalt-zinc-cadmium efflux system outer membrane protein
MEAAMRSTEAFRNAVKGLALSAALGGALLSGCATVQPDARFAEVNEAATRRLAQNLVWNRNSDQDRRARAAVEQLLKQELTVSAAVQIALLNNRDLQASYARLGIVQADLVEAGLLQNPVFVLTIVRGSGASIVEGSVVQDFVGILSISARRKAGEAAAQRVTMEVAERAFDLAKQIEAQYYTVVADAQALELAGQVAAATQAAAELAQRQREAGNLSRREQNIQQAFYAQTLLDLAQSESQLASDRERLNRSMGLWGGDIDWRTVVRLPKVPDTLPALDQVEAQAVTQRLDLSAAKQAAYASAQALSLTRQFRYLSALGIGVAYKREPDVGAMVGPTIELGLPLFDRGETRVARAQAELARDQEHLAALAIDIRSQAREARTRLIAARDIVRHYEKALLPLQQSIVDDTLKLHSGMLIGAYDLLLAKQNQVATARQYIAASKEYWLAWTDLERAVGGRIARAPPPAGEARPAVPAPSALSHDEDTQSDH